MAKKIKQSKLDLLINQSLKATSINSEETDASGGREARAPGQGDFSQGRKIPAAVSSVIRGCRKGRQSNGKKGAFEKRAVPAGAGAPEEYRPVSAVSSDGGSAVRPGWYPETVLDPAKNAKKVKRRKGFFPDEVLRLPNEQVLVLLRGQKPLLLYKIIPDELPSFRKLSPVRIVDYVPEWKRAEDETKDRAAKIKPKTAATEPLTDSTVTVQSGIGSDSDRSARSTRTSPSSPPAPKRERGPGCPAKYHFIPEEEIALPDERAEPEPETETITDDEVLGLFETEEATPDEIIG